MEDEKTEFEDPYESLVEGSNEDELEEQNDSGR